MRPLRVALVSFGVLLAAGSVHAQVAVKATGGAPGEEQIACSPERRACVFTDLQGDNTYTIDGESFRRTADRQQVFRLNLKGGAASVKVLLASINKTRTQIVIASEQVTLPTGTLFNPGSLSPDQVHRSHWLSVRNPKSGEEIKAIETGMFRPLALGMTANGDYVFTAGDELQLRRREIRIYNTRSGKQEFAAAVDPSFQIRLYERGFLAGSVYYAADLGGGGAVRKHNSPNSYSIAEFTVRKGDGLSPGALEGQAIGVIGFQGGTPELRDMLDSALAIKLGAAGFKVAERQRLKDLLEETRFQNLGLTDSGKAAELGRLVNAQYLLFAQLQRVGTLSSLALRLVGVQDGALKNGIELECRDCSPDDYLQGLTFLIQDWVD